MDSLFLFCMIIFALYLYCCEVIKVKEILDQKENQKFQQYLYTRGYLITDEKAPQQILDELTEAGVKVHLVRKGDFANI